MTYRSAVLINARLQPGAKTRAAVGFTWLKPGVNENARTFARK